MLRHSVLMPIHLFDIFGPGEPFVRAIALALIAVLWTVLLVRIVGLRSFSKMTNYDFVTTVATGSIIAQAATRSDWLEYLAALGAIAGVFFAQYLLARMRQASDTAQDLIRNRPVLLVRHGRFCEAALAQTRVSKENILGKIRAANVGSMENVGAVVLETTGDISVLSGEVDPRLLDSVITIDKP